MLTQGFEDLVARDRAHPREEARSHFKRMSLLRHHQERFLNEIICEREVGDHGKDEPAHGRLVLDKQALHFGHMGVRVIFFAHQNSGGSKEHMTRPGKNLAAWEKF